MLLHTLTVLLSGFSLVLGTTAKDESACDVDETAATAASRTSTHKLSSLDFKRNQKLKHKSDTTYPIH